MPSLERDQAINIIKTAPQRQEPGSRGIQDKSSIQSSAEFTEKPNTSKAANKQNQKSKSFWQRLKTRAINYAKIIDSRESIYRAALDLIAFDIPAALAAATRNLSNFIETSFEMSVSFGLYAIAPFLTTTVSKIVAQFMLPKDLREQVEYLLKFEMKELKSKEAFAEGLKRIKDEEPKDQERIAKLYQELGNQESNVKYYKAKAQECKDFCNKFKTTDKMRELIFRLKRAVIVSESAFEGAFWGAFGFIIRAFRKYALGINRFTGTKGYLSDKDSKKLGEAGDMSKLQKILAIFPIFMSPLVNLFFINKSKDPNLVKQSSFWQTIEKHIDMTHGIFPKLGLLFTYSTLPKWTSAFITAQGWDERIERLIKFLTLIPSWWFGHRATNGYMANRADKHLADKYKVDRGILVEPEYLGRILKEPARIHQVMAKTENNPELRKEATDQHAKIFYKGFSLHSVLMWLIFMAVNKITKMRVLKKLKRKEV